MRWLTRKRLQGERRNELGSASREHYAHHCALLFEQPHQLCALVGRDAPRDRHQNVALV